MKGRLTFFRDNGCADKEVTFSFHAGAPGITPHIGENGNWFLGMVDTGVLAGGFEVLQKNIDQISKDIEILGSMLGDATLLLDSINGNNL